MAVSFKLPIAAHSHLLLPIVLDNEARPGEAAVALCPDHLGRTDVAHCRRRAPSGKQAGQAIVVMQRHTPGCSKQDWNCHWAGEDNKRKTTRHVRHVAGAAVLVPIGCLCTRDRLTSCFRAHKNRRAQWPAVVLTMPLLRDRSPASSLSTISSMSAVSPICRAVQYSC